MAEKLDTPGGIDNTSDISNIGKITKNNENLSSTKKLKNRARLFLERIFLF